jgi:hypothetical protein
MISHSRFLFVTAILALGLAACGGGGDDTTETPDAAAEPDAEVVPDADTTPLTVADAYHESIALACAKAFECRDSFPGTPTEFTDAYGDTEEACIANFEALVGQAAADTQASVDAGRIVYNADDARTCLDGLATIDCPSYWNGDNQPAECDTTFIGQVADGGPCTIDDDCATDAAYCDETTNVCTL